MKVLSAGKKALREAVPSVAKLVDLIRTNGVSVGNRDKLHSRRSEGIETWQLTATSGQSKRKRLNAVAEEIAAGKNIAGIELLINFGDEAGQVIKRWGNHRRLPGGEIGRGPWMFGKKLCDHRIGCIRRGQLPIWTGAGIWHIGNGHHA